MCKAKGNLTRLRKTFTNKSSEIMRKSSDVKKRHKSIHEWSEENRPRDKAMRHGIEALTNAELLAILIGSGTPDEDAVTLMQRILEEQGDSLQHFCRLDYDDLIKYKGIGPAKAITILAATELAKRRSSSTDEVRMCDKAEVAYELMLNKMCDLSVETCHVIALNQRLQYISEKEISSGGYTATIVDPRVVLRYVLSKNAVAMILAHNHPSGSLKPSREDDMLTERVKRACETIGIRFIDHIIVTNKGYYSYSENDRL